MRKPLLVIFMILLYIPAWAGYITCDSIYPGTFVTESKQDIYRRKYKKDIIEKLKSKNQELTKEIYALKIDEDKILEHQIKILDYELATVYMLKDYWIKLK